MTFMKYHNINYNFIVLCKNIILYQGIYLQWSSYLPCDNGLVWKWRTPFQRTLVVLALQWGSAACRCAPGWGVWFCLKQKWQVWSLELEFSLHVYCFCLPRMGSPHFNSWHGGSSLYISQIVGLKHRFGECVKKTQNHWNSWKATLRKKRVTPPCATQDPESKYSRLHVGFNFGRPELCVLLQLCVTYDLNRVISSPSTQQKSLIATIMGLGHSICGSNWLLIFIGNMDITAAPDRLFPDLSWVLAAVKQPRLPISMLVLWVKSVGLQTPSTVYYSWLVVWTPLKNMKVNWDDEIPNIKQNWCSKPPTR